MYHVLCFGLLKYVCVDTGAAMWPPRLLLPLIGCFRFKGSEVM